MKLPFSLIKKFFNFDIEPVKVADILINLGIEIEKIYDLKPSFTSVVVGKVLDVKKHPNADKLNITIVFDGENNYQVICGASNCRKDLYVAFAKEGAVLENGSFKIKKAKIRGVESYGMLCAFDELGLFGIKDDKIIELQEIVDVNELKLGQDVSFLLDPVFDISLTPNLGHCMSSIGIAREIATGMNKNIQKLKFPLVNEEIEKKIDIIIDETCDMYCCRVIENIEVAKSPFWLVKALNLCEMRSINPIVDVLNYVMLLYGQPMHAFDFAKISEDKKINVGVNKKEIEVACLDDINRTIPKNAIIVEDKDKILAIAGIIGGKTSCVDENTRSILIEAANFDPLYIRKATKLLNLRTQSSNRFEKKIDKCCTKEALEYACYLIQNICKGKVSNLIEVSKSKHTCKIIKCRLLKINDILGLELSVNEVKEIFKRLFFKSEIVNDVDFLVTIPSFRNDIDIEVDLIEEVARVYGYNNIKKSTKRTINERAYFGESSNYYEFEKKIKETLVREGYQEVISYNLISASLVNILYNEFSKDCILKVLHCKSSEHAFLRPTLLTSFLQIAKHNIDFNVKDISIFETSKIHVRKEGKIIEQDVVGLMSMGCKLPYYWDKNNKTIDFWDLKGNLENLFSFFFKIKIEDIDLKKSKHGLLHPGKQMDIFYNKKHLGVMGEVHPEILKHFDLIDNKIYFAEVNLQNMFVNQNIEIEFSPFNIFPSSSRDWTITLGKDQIINDVLDKTKNISKILEKVFLLDIYEKKELLQKNVTFRFIYRSKNKTLSFEEIETEHKKIINKIIKSIEK